MNASPHFTNTLIKPATLILILLFVLACSATATSAQDLNQKMSKLGEAMAQLFPLVVNNAEFTKPSNHKKIEQNLAIMADTIKKVESHFENKSPTYMVSYNIIKTHVHDIQNAYENGRVSHAQAMLRATASICLSCHSQDKVQRKLFKGVSRSSFTTDFEYAEYNFITRNYASAIEYYRNYLNNLGDHSSENDQLTATRNILMAYIQVLGDFKGAIKEFKALKSKPKLTRYTKKNIEAWLDGLEKLNAEKAATTKVSYQQLRDYVESFINPGDGPFKAEYHFWIRGMLYRYLSDNPPEAQIPSLLYWLSITDRTTNHSYYYSLGDLYLKHCMLNYSSSPYAKKCFEEYRDYIEFSFSGSRGTDIPEDVQEELDRLRGIVYKDSQQGNN